MLPRPRPAERWVEGKASREVAADRLREQVEKYWGDEALLRRAAQVLDHAERRGHTIALLRHVPERAVSRNYSMPTV